MPNAFETSIMFSSTLLSKSITPFAFGPTIIFFIYVSGAFNKEIALTLNISERTVKNHVSNIFKKIGVSDRTQAAVFAIKNNIISIK